MRFGYDHDAGLLHDAEKLLAASVDDFTQLTALTDKSYRNAAGMETSQRTIPVRGGPKTQTICAICCRCIRKNLRHLSSG